MVMILGGMSGSRKFRKKKQSSKHMQIKRNSLKQPESTRAEGVSYMFKENAVKLGIAPIGWTNDDLPDLGAENTFEQCISEMALAGFTGTEVGNKYPRDTKVLKKALELRNMEI